MINTNLDITANITTNFIYGIFAAVVLLVGVSIWVLNKNPNAPFSWVHLLADPVTNKGSLSKVLQLIGGITGTFIVILQATQKILSAEMFMIYLGALGVSEAFSKWASLKYSQNNTETPTVAVAAAAQPTIPQA